jgi:hypothetical protein
VGVGAGSGAGGSTGGTTPQADSNRANTHGLARNGITGEDGSGQKTGNEYNNGGTRMESQGLGWLLLEAGIALALFMFIVWWTMKK